MEEEERIYWEERRRYEDELEYYEWHRRFGRGPQMGPPMPPPPPPRAYMMGMPAANMGPPTVSHCFVNKFSFWDYFWLDF